MKSFYTMNEFIKKFKVVVLVLWEQ